MMKKGIFGCNLLNQVIVIGIAYCALSLMGIVFGFLLVAHPEKFSGVSEFNSALEDNQEVLDEESWRSSSSEDGEEGLEESGEVTAEEDLMYRDEIFEEGEVGTTDDRRAVIENENLSAEVSLDDSRQTEEGLLKEDIEVPQTAEESRHLMQLIKHIQGDGVEVLIESALSLTCSLVLLHGVRTNRHWLLLPWLIDTVMEMVAGFLQVTIQAAREQWTMTTARILGVLLFYFLGGYCLYSVASYQVLLRRMNKNSDQIINSVCQAGGFQDLVGGRNYRRLEEEVWQSEPNLGEELRRAEPQHGFTREKKVEDDRPDQDEHVLYVQC